MLDMVAEMAVEEERLPDLNYIAGKGLMQPFANTNSGARKLMFSTQLEHSLPLISPEIPIIQTGYEIRFGSRSSSIIKANADYEVIDKISKFSANPNHHYFLVVRDTNSGLYDIIERVSYNHTTETYGYLYNNDVLDRLEPGFEIQDGDILRSSFAFDEYMNRCDGVNLVTTYIGNNKTQEDGIQISQSAAKKLMSPLIKKIQIPINDNDILLNLFGTMDNFKSFPDIGENINGGILCAVRREKTEEALYTQSIDRLSKLMMSDDKYTVEGTVIDLDVYCNNPETLGDKCSNRQIAYYYNERRRFNTELVQLVKDLKIPMNAMSYNLQKIYDVASKELGGYTFIKDRLFSGTVLEFVVVEYNVPKVGDKITNRYGGKGVISQIVPDHLMPLLDDGTRVEVIFNQSTCVNRLNEGQLNEMSLNFIGSRICEYIAENKMDTYTAIGMIADFIRMVSPIEAEELESILYSDEISEEDREWFVDNVITSKYILLSIKPITESMSLDKLDLIYKRFPFIKQYSVMTPIMGSNGRYRYVKGRRKLVAAKMYIYRLKQYAEEKFSAVSLSSTNIKNENTRNKANKNYRSLHSNTPIKFGEMECEDMQHMGAEYVISALMIHSVSPQARRLVESALTGDPYNVNIVLDSTSKNRNVEILNTYLKTMGIRLVFTKIRKVQKFAFDYKAFVLPVPGQQTQMAFTLIDDNSQDYNVEEDLERMKKMDDAVNSRAFTLDAFTCYDEDGDPYPWIDPQLERIAEFDEMYRGMF